MIQPTRGYVDRIWFRGRLIRKLTRLYCRVVGHRFNPWHFDWPYDDWHEDMGEPRDPSPWETLHWIRGCERDCGTHETAKASLDAREFLPGEVASIEDNVIRRSAGWT